MLIAYDCAFKTNGFPSRGDKIARRSKCICNRSSSPIFYQNLGYIFVRRIDPRPCPRRHGRDRLLGVAFDTATTQGRSWTAPLLLLPWAGGRGAWFGGGSGAESVRHHVLPPVVVVCVDQESEGREGGAEDHRRYVRSSGRAKIAFNTVFRRLTCADLCARGFRRKWRRRGFCFRETQQQAGRRASMPLGRRSIAARASGKAAAVDDDILPGSDQAGYRWCCGATKKMRRTGLA